MSRQLCDTDLCTSQAVTFDDAQGFRCEAHAAADSAVTR